MWLYDIKYNVDKNKVINKFKLHNHNGIEIFLFISGDADYIVEGTTYHLKPFDLIVIRPDEMHRALRKSDAEFKRMVLSINTDFFFANNCTEYYNIYKNYEPGKNNKIPADIIKECGFYDCFVRLQKYSNNFKNAVSPVCEAIVIEMLYIINTIDIYSELADEDSQVSKIVKYINNNFKSTISLDQLSEKMYISKTHMCRIFKKATGYTINNYVNHKRLINVSELCKSGTNISLACIESGFKSYANFYKTYVKENHTSPRYGLK